MILSSKDQFIPKYKDGSKKHSIRRGERWREGMTIQFFAKTRTPQMHKFMPDLKVTRVDRITITFFHQLEVSVNDQYLYRPEIEKLAKNDGFDTIEAFRDFFFPEGSDEDSFHGQLIHWTDEVNYEEPLF